MVKAHLVRDGDVSDNHLRVWRRVPLESPVRAMVYGSRTLSDGRVYSYSERDDFFGGGAVSFVEYRSTRAYKAYLVSPGMRRKTMRVLPEDLEALDG